MASDCEQQSISWLGAKQAASADGSLHGARPEHLWVAASRNYLNPRPRNQESTSHYVSDMAGNRVEAPHKAGSADIGDLGTTELPEPYARLVALLRPIPNGYEAADDRDPGPCAGESASEVSLEQGRVHEIWLPFAHERCRSSCPCPASPRPGKGSKARP